MIKFISQLVAVFLAIASPIYMWHKLLKRKIDFKNKKLYISLVCLMVIAFFNYAIVNQFIRITLVTVALMLFFRFLFQENFRKCILTPIFTQMIVMISETIFILFIVTILKLDLTELKNQFLQTLMVNIATSLNSILIISIPFVRKIYDLILSTISKINQKFLIIFSLFIIGIANVLAMITYYEVDIRWIIIINVIYTLFCFVLVLYSFKMQSNYNNVSDKYNVAINSLTDYENMMSKYRIDNHENKNLLYTIRAMILNKERDIPKYIDSIVKEKYEDNEKLLFNVSVIPSGGLRATIYSEILKIKDNNINYSLSIDSKLKTIDLIDLDTDDIIDICKVICVFIDNAIEEVKKLRKKNIEIALYVEDNILNIKVSNNYKEKVEVDKIFNEGYTTKGNGHGYGLALVKRIVDKNKNFTNTIEISKKVFSQILSIKYKKHIN